MEYCRVKIVIAILYIDTQLSSAREEPNKSYPLGLPPAVLFGLFPRKVQADSPSSKHRWAPGSSSVPLSCWKPALPPGPEDAAGCPWEGGRASTGRLFSFSGPPPGGRLRPGCQAQDLRGPRGSLSAFLAGHVLGTWGLGVSPPRLLPGQSWGHEAPFLESGLFPGGLPLPA